MSKKKKEILYVVQNNDWGFPRYLDSANIIFDNTPPVWRSNLQSIDPLIKFETAVKAAKISKGIVKIVFYNSKCELQSL